MHYHLKMLRSNNAVIYNIQDETISTVSIRKLKPCGLKRINVDILKLSDEQRELLKHL